MYLPAIAGHLPAGMVCALSAFLDFCYLVHCSVLNEVTLDAINAAIDHFHQEHSIFITSGIHVHLSLLHYYLVCQMGCAHQLQSQSTSEQ